MPVDAMKVNWKTTATGITSIVLGVGGLLTSIGTALRLATDGDPETVVNLELVTAQIAAEIGTITVGIGLLLAKDGDNESAPEDN